MSKKSGGNDKSEETIKETVIMEDAFEGGVQERDLDLSTVKNQEDLVEEIWEKIDIEESRRQGRYMERYLFHVGPKICWALAFGRSYWWPK